MRVELVIGGLHNIDQEELTSSGQRDRDANETVKLGQ